MKSYEAIFKASLMLSLLAVLAFGTQSYGKGKPKPKPDNECPRTGILCTLQYDPVICDNGVTYSNACFAYVACATGCVSTGDGGPFPIATVQTKGGPAPCPKIYAPVICDRGRIFPNQCEADKKHAKNCEPLGF